MTPFLVMVRPCLQADLRCYHSYGARPEQASDMLFTGGGHGRKALLRKSCGCQKKKFDCDFCRNKFDCRSRLSQVRRAVHVQARVDPGPVLLYIVSESLSLGTVFILGDFEYKRRTVF